MSPKNMNFHIIVLETTNYDFYLEIIQEVLDNEKELL